MCLFIYLYVSEYFARMYVSALHECSTHGAPKRALASLELGLQVVRKHCGGASPRASGRAAHALRHDEAATNFSLAVWKKVPPKALEPAFST